MTHFEDADGCRVEPTEIQFADLWGPTRFYEWWCGHDGMSEAPCDSPYEIAFEVDE